MIILIQLIGRKQFKKNNMMDKANLEWLPSMIGFEVNMCSKTIWFLGKVSRTLKISQNNYSKINDLKNYN